eukprot:3190919-Amphidinium_carterae.1
MTPPSSSPKKAARTYGRRQSPTLGVATFTYTSTTLCSTRCAVTEAAKTSLARFYATTFWDNLPALKCQFA